MRGKGFPGAPLQVEGFVRCPANDDSYVKVLDACYGCELYDIRNTPADGSKVYCWYVHDNRNLRAVLANRDEIVAACVRGPQGYDCRVDCRGRVYTADRAVP